MKRLYCFIVNLVQRLKLTASVLKGATSLALVVLLAFPWRTAGVSGGPGSVQRSRGAYPRGGYCCDNATVIGASSHSVWRKAPIFLLEPYFIWPCRSIIKHAH